MDVVHSRSSLLTELNCSVVVLLLAIQTHCRKGKIELALVQERSLAFFLRNSTERGRSTLLYYKSVKSEAVSGA